MAKKVNKKELGLGIRALLGGNIEEEIRKDKAPEIIRELNSGIVEIALEQIEANPYQPRNEFDQQALYELAESIKTYGLIQPLTIRRLGKDSYQLISGERRLRASKIAGLTHVPAYIRVANDQEMLEMALVENIQRKDLNAIEIAISYQRLMDECNLTHEALSERIGKDRSTVTNYTRLLKLPPEIQQSLKKSEISMGHARALAGINDIALQLALARKTLEEDLSVRNLEEIIRNYHKKTTTATRKTPQSDPYKSVIRDLADKLDTLVKIKTKNNGTGGSIIIEFEDTQDLNRILDIIGH